MLTYAIICLLVLRHVLLPLYLYLVLYTRKIIFFYTNNLPLLKLEALPTAPLEALGEYGVNSFDLCRFTQSP